MNVSNTRIEYYTDRIVVSEDVPHQRLDSFLFNYLSDEITVAYPEISLSRSKIQKFIKEAYIMVNEVPVKRSYQLKGGDVIDIKIPLEFGKELDVNPEKLYFEIIYFDRDIIVINKPQGLVVHPAHGHYSHTLINGIIYYFPELKKNTNFARFGLVHRLDKDTSGLLVIARNDIAQINLSTQFKLRKVEKEYVAIVKGHLKNHSGEVSTRIGRNPIHRKKMAVLLTDGKEALTTYKVIEYLNNHTFVKLYPHTGRTHQLRVHMNYLGHPIVGDPIYSRNRTEFDRFGLMLCARRLKFYHPQDNRELNFEIDIPDRFKILLEKLKGEE